MVDLKHIEEHVERVRLAKKVTAEMKQMEADSRAVIEEALGESEVGEIDGELVITWKHNKIRKFNEKAFKEAHPEEHAAYVEAREQRRFEVQ